MTLSEVERAIHYWQGAPGRHVVALQSGEGDQYVWQLFEDGLHTGLIRLWNDGGGYSGSFSGSPAREIVGEIS